MLALGMVKTLLSLYQNTPVYTAARNLLDSIATPLDKPGTPAASGARWYEERIIAPPVPSISVVPDVWLGICEGLRENRVLAFEYRSTWNDGYHSRQVHPYQLLFDNGSWYLYAWSCERRGTRMFSLTRMKNICLMDKKFNLPKKWDYRAHTNGGFLGVYTDDQKRHFRIRFFNDAAMRVQERRWAKDQRITETPDGVTLEFTSTQYGKVLELVLSQGRDALPLEPAELVKDWKSHVQDMAQRIL
jgi:predicted DNA-binding transcriptional regulator YafY